MALFSYFPCPQRLSPSLFFNRRIWGPASLTRAFVFRALTYRIHARPFLYCRIFNGLPAISLLFTLFLIAALSESGCA